MFPFLGAWLVVMAAPEPTAAVSRRAPRLRDLHATDIFSWPDKPLLFD